MQMKESLKIRLVGRLEFAGLLYDPNGRNLQGIFQVVWFRNRSVEAPAYCEVTQIEVRRHDHAGSS